MFNPIAQPSNQTDLQLLTLINSVEQGSTYLNATLRIYDSNFQMDEQGNLVDGLELVSFCLSSPAFSIIEAGLAVLNQVAPGTVINAGVPAMFAITDKDNIIRLVGTAGAPAANKQLKIAPLNADPSCKTIVFKKGELVKMETLSIKVKIIG